jgi:hypothetical protein
VLAGIVGIEILVHVEYQVSCAAVEVGDVLEGCEGAVGYEACGGCPVVSREEDHLLGCTGLANSSHTGLNRGCPEGDTWYYFLSDICHFLGLTPSLTVVRLIHDPKYDLRFTGVFLGELGPKIRKLSITRPTLSYDTAVPSCI